MFLFLFVCLFVCFYQGILYLTSERLFKWPTRQHCTVMFFGVLVNHPKSLKTTMITFVAVQCFWLFNPPKHQNLLFLAFDTVNIYRFQHGVMINTFTVNASHRNKINGPVQGIYCLFCWRKVGDGGGRGLQFFFYLS